MIYFLDKPVKISDKLLKFIAKFKINSEESLAHNGI